MQHRVIIIMLLVATSLTGYSQDTDMLELEYKSRWQVRPALGVSIPLTKLFDGEITDDLVQYNDGASRYLQAIAVTYFFSKHWGVEFNYQGNSSDKVAERHNRFMRNLNNEYAEDYYVDASSGAQYTKHNAIAGDFGRGFLGIVYRKEIGRLYIYPKMSLGVSSFYTDWGRAVLKEKNSNTYLHVEYSEKELPKDYITLAPSVSMGYKLSRRVFLNLDVATSYFKTNFTYTKTTKDLYTEEEMIKEFAYKKDIVTVSVGAGLIVVIR